MAALYIVAQVAGAIVGAMVANAMFDLPLVEWSTTSRSGANLWLPTTSPRWGCSW